MRHQALIGHSMLTQPRLSQLSAILRSALALVIAAGICACHSGSDSSAPAGNPIVGRWQAQIFNQQCVIEIANTGQISYGDSCPPPLTGQRATITSLPNGTYAPNLYVTGQDSGTFSIMGGAGGISGTVGAFRVEGEHMTTRTAPGADVQWTRSSSEAPMQSAAASQVLPGQVQWPMGDVPAIAQRALAYVRAKWQPDAFLTSIQMELVAGGFSNAQSPEGGLQVQFSFYSPGQQKTLALMPNSPAGELMPGGSADPNDERPMPASFVDLPEAVAKLRAKGLRGKQIKSVHIENYSRGSYGGAGDIALYGPEWVIASALDERGAVLAELPDQNDARLYNPDADASGDQPENDNTMQVEITGLRNNKTQVYCWLFTSAKGFPLNTGGDNAASISSWIRNGRAKCDFGNEDPGPYAVVVFHDEDNSHVLELNPDGTPREGVGLSNNPQYASALPGYDAAMFTYRTGQRNLTINMKYPDMQMADAARSIGGASLAGFAFVDGSVAGQGARAKLPPGTKIYPPGSTITGTDGCPTTRYHTDGMIVAVIDYQGRPTAGSLTVTRHPARGGRFENAPYYLDLDPGRKLQLLGPIFENGSYNVRLQYDFSQGQGHMVRARFVLARSCSTVP